MYFADHIQNLVHRAEKFVTMDVLGNDNRWLVTLVTSNKVVAPVLQDVVKQGMDKLYATLDSYLNGLPTPCSLQTLTYADVCRLAATPSPASSLKDLNFGNINNNSGVHGKTKTAYNYNVNNLVDLAKLYLPYYLKNSKTSNLLQLMTNWTTCQLRRRMKE